jgi:hypothetical protein
MASTIGKSLAGSDIAAQLDTDKIIENQNEKKRQALVKKVEEDAAVMQKEIFDTINPNPVYVALIIIGILAAIWLLYVLLVKKTICGEWRDTDKCTWFIKQNRFTNDLGITITKNGDIIDRGRGKLSGNVFSYKGNIGVWNQSNVVVFVNGGGLQKVT